MASTTTAPWADTPFELIRVPGNGTDIEKGPEAIYIAAEMASAHNGMLRGLNSIYQQCIHVMLPADVADLLKYTEFWCGWLEEHHAAEETFFFPAVEKAAGVKGLMEGNVEQHHTFLPGLERLERYAKETTVEDYEGKEMRGIIDGFGAAMTTHLREEIETLLGLEKFDGVVMKKLWLEFDAKLREGDKARHLLIFAVHSLIWCFSGGSVSSGIRHFR